MPDQEILDDWVLINECRGEFWLSLAEAAEQAGGSIGLADTMRDWSLKEVIDMLGSNGVRFTFDAQHTLTTKKNQIYNAKSI